MNLKFIAGDLRATGLQWLADAADTIEQALAGQTYEYALQVLDEDGTWKFAESHRLGDEPAFADWNECASVPAVREVRSWKGHTTRIVRRLVGEIEVVE